MSGLAEPTLRDLESRHASLTGQGQVKHEEFARARREAQQLAEFLDLAPSAVARMEELSADLFGEILDEIEVNLTHAVCEVLGQDRTVTSLRETKGNRLTVHFQIYSGSDKEHVEDILTGQGGSVANILSVGLRLIALSQLDKHRHRPFLVLDEQDCWLKPELVPVFMKLISQIADRLEIQLLVISHHPLDIFAGAAQRILALEPSLDGPTLSVLTENEL